MVMSWLSIYNFLFVGYLYLYYLEIRLFLFSAFLTFFNRIFLFCLFLVYNFGPLMSFFWHCLLCSAVSIPEIVCVRERD